MNSKTIFYWVGGVVITFLLLFLVYKLVASPKITDFKEVNIVRKNDNVKWSEDNKNILVEYSDLQCPACKGFYDIMKTYESSSSPNFDITKKVTLVFRHFPLYQIHNNAFTAAYAAEAAGIQNKFWEMTDLLFSKQTEWSNLQDPKNYFSDLAKSLQLNVERFNSDMNSQEVIDKVQANLSEGESIGVNSTPTFFLNGKKVQVNTFEEFTNLLKSL